MRTKPLLAGLRAALLALTLAFVAFGRPEVRLEAAPMLGPTSSVGPGWVTIQVRLENPGGAPVSGTVELRARPGWTGDEERHLTRVPFALEPHARVALELPTHGFSARPPELSVRVYDAEENQLAEAVIGEFRQVDPLLFDLSQPSRIAATVRGLGVVISRRSRGSYRAPVVGVSSPIVDPATGEPLLPRWAAGYGNATLVVAPSRRLATLAERDLVALADWVLSGGALAISIERPEDLRFSGLTAMVGEGVRETPPLPALLEPELFYVPTEQALGTTPPPSMPERATLRREELAPPSRLIERLHGYTGGNLRPTPWGAAASYGLGEVHFLAFPIDEHAVVDRWIQLKLVDLTRHAWERQAQVAMPLGQNALDDHRTSIIRKVLDPNENMRWTIVVSAVVLLLYAGLAGPLNFYLASRRGRPLRAVLWLPVWAALTMLAIVTIGIAGKGVKGRARKLSLVESGAGMSRAAATRFRGLYASSAKELSVRPTSHSNLVDVASEDEFVERHLVVERDGVRVAGLRAKPWQTLVLREDGPFELGGGVSLTLQGAEVVVKNRTARDLIGVILKLPDGTFVSFPRIADGAVVRSGQGSKLTFSAPAVTAFSRPLGAASLKGELDKAADGAADAWEALSSYAGNEVDWWPSDVPVLIGQLEGGEGRATDTGLDVDVDRVLLRVVGVGGVP